MSGKGKAMFTMPAPEIPKKGIGKFGVKLVFALIVAIGLLWAFFSIPQVQSVVNVASRWIFLEQKAKQLESSNRRLEAQVDQLQKENAKLTEQIPASPEQGHSRLDAMAKLAESVKKSLLTLTPENSFEIEHSENGITIRIWQDTLFPLDSTYVHSQGRAILEKIMASLKNSTKGMSLDVEGHSDSQALRASMQGRFETNREMSAARAVNIANMFEKAEFLPPSKICAISWGESKPVAAENTPEAFAKNRRIELVFSWGLDLPKGE